jgi:putative transcriptional regulator
VGLKGKLLIALPVLRDANFDRTIVYMLEHSDDGAVGVVINRPSPLGVGEPLPDWVPMAAEPAVVFVGGPVGPRDAIGLLEDISGNLAPVDLEQGPAALAGSEGGRLRVFAGYAGWTGGQLEDEIAAGAWFVADTHPGDVMTDDPDELWERVLKRQPGSIAAVATFPTDPRLN